MQLISYLTFNGRCEEAIEYYQQHLDAEVLMMMRFADMPEQDNEDCQMPPDMAQKIMHAELQIGQTQIMMSDGAEQGHGEFKGFALSVTVDSLEQAETIFNALAAEGNVTMPLASTFWAKVFGILEDKFGLQWMVSLDK